MEERGLVERRQIAGNRKNVHVFLTAAGRSLERELVPLAIEVNRVSMRGLDADTVNRTRRALLAMIENLADDEASPAVSPPARSRSSRKSTGGTPR